MRGRFAIANRGVTITKLSFISGGDGVSVGLLAVRASWIAVVGSGVGWERRATSEGSYTATGGLGT